jgi:hypothetical protein
VAAVDTVEKRRKIGVSVPARKTLARITSPWARRPGGRRDEDAVGRGAAGVDDALGDALAVEMGDLLEEVVVLEHQRPARAHAAACSGCRGRVALARRQADLLVLGMAESFSGGVTV